MSEDLNNFLNSDPEFEFVRFADDFCIMKEKHSGKLFISKPQNPVQFGQFLKEKGYVTGLSIQRLAIKKIQKENRETRRKKKRERRKHRNMKLFEITYWATISRQETVRIHAKNKADARRAFNARHPGACIITFKEVET